MSVEEQLIQDQKALLHEELRYRTPWARQYHAWLFEKMIALLQPRGRLLDLGCGTGVLSEFLPRERCHRIDEIIGVDISQEMVRYAKTRLDRAVVADSCCLPFGNETFDTVFAKAVLHHLSAPEAGIREIARILRPGGRSIFWDTHKNVLTRLPRRLLRGGRHFSSSHEDFNEKHYLELLSSQFEILHKEYVGYAGYVLLGFPDIFSAYRFVPGKRLITPALIQMDKICGCIPVVRRLSLGLLVVVEKRNE